MAQLAPTAHFNLHLVRNALLASESAEVPWQMLGDSRSSFRHYRRPGGFFRQVDVKHAALVCAMVGSSNMVNDGLGALQIALTGITNNVAAPGATLSGSGIVNRLPSELLEAWTTGAVSNPHFGRYAIIYSTAGTGGEMDSTNSNASTGGTFKRGDPAQGRNVASVERFAVTDNRSSSAWLQNRIEYGYDGTESGVGPTVFSAPPSAPGTDLLVTAETMAGVGTGTRITARNRHNSGTAAVSTGLITVAQRINFAGGQGVVLGVCAQSAWATTDHLPDTVSGNANPDWKYSDAGMIEWYSKVMKVAGKAVVVDIDVGQNGSTEPNFPEWNGTTVGGYPDNITDVALRHATILGSLGASSILVLLRAPWQAGADSLRIDAYRAALKEIAQSEDAARSGGARWAFYDQEAALRAGGYSDGGANGLSASLREDAVHQNFDGMNTLESVFNSEVMGAYEGSPTSSPSRAVMQASAMPAARLATRVLPPRGR